MSVEIQEKTDGYTILTWRRVMLLVWRDRAGARGIDRSRALLSAWAATQPGGAVLLTVIPQRSSGPPDEETRAAMSRALGSAAEGVRGLGTIYEATGFIAAFHRALMSRMQRAHAGALQVRVFRTPAEAAPWAAELLGDPEITAEGLAEVLRVTQER